MTAIAREEQFMLPAKAHELDKGASSTRIGIHVITTDRVKLYTSTCFKNGQMVGEVEIRVTVTYDYPA